MGEFVSGELLAWVLIHSLVCDVLGVQKVN